MSQSQRSDAYRNPLSAGRLLKETLAGGGICAGAIVKIPSPDLIEVLAGTELDFVIADAEHGPIGPETCQAMVRAGDAVGLPVLARIGESGVPGTVTRFLDTGIAGAHVPHISAVDSARQAFSLFLHPMQGRRGLAAGRWARYGAVVPLPELVAALPHSLLLVAQIEDAAAFENLDALLQLDEPDVFFIGPTDLASSMGLRGNKGNERVIERIDEAVARIVAAGRTPGILASNVAEAERYARAGVRYFVFNAETLVQAGTATALAGITTRTA